MQLLSLLPYLPDIVLQKAVANVGAVGAAADGAAGSLGDATKAAEELEKALWEL